MPAKKTPKAVERAIRKATAKGLLAAALHLQKYLKEKLSASFPPASLPGQYPHYRTGTGRDAVVVVPRTLAEVEQSLECGVAYEQQGWYMLHLELEKGRKGLLAAQDEQKEVMGAIVAKAAAGGKG